MPPKRVLKASAAWFNDIKRYSDWDADTFRTWQREMNDACAVAALDMEEEKVDVVKARTGGGYVKQLKVLMSTQFWTLFLIL